MLSQSLSLHESTCSLTGDSCDSLAASLLDLSLHASGTTRPQNDTARVVVLGVWNPIRFSLARARVCACSVRVRVADADMFGERAACVRANLTAHAAVASAACDIPSCTAFGNMYHSCSVFVCVLPDSLISCENGSGQLWRKLAPCAVRSAGAAHSLPPSADAHTSRRRRTLRAHTECRLCAKSNHRESIKFMQAMSFH